MSVLSSILLFLAVIAAVTVVWDVAKRHLALTEALKREQAAVSLQSALLEYQERNDRALTNFLAQMKEVVRYTETERQAAKGSQLNQSLNGRWKNK